MELFSNSYSTFDLCLVGALIFGVVFVNLPGSKAPRKDGKSLSASSDDVASIKLLKDEKKYLSFRSISTVSFFSGGSIKEAEAYYRDRLDLILEFNPWLDGCITQDETSNLCLNFATVTSSSQVDSIFRVDESLLVYHKMPYDSLMKELEAKKVLPVNSRSPISSFVLAPDMTDKSGFALIVAMSHTVADGYTYYKILSMLSPDVEVCSLEVDRKHNFMDHSDKILKNIQPNVMKLLPFKMLAKLVSGAKNAVCCHFVDAEKVAVMKERVKKDKEGDKNVPYISTMDVVLSHFANITRPRILLCPVNLRTRVSVLGDNDAGNYEAPLLFDPVSYGCPSSVRKVILSQKDDQPFQHSGSALGMAYPSWYETLINPLCFVSSWIFDCYSGDLSFGNNALLFHLPLIADLDSIPIGLLVHFKANKQSRAVLCISSIPSLAEQLVANNSPLTKQCFPMSNT